MGRIIFLFLCILFSCKQQPVETEINNTDNPSSIEIDSVELDRLLKCGEFDIREGHYRIPDYGCVYSPKNENKLGNADVILIPLTEKFNTNNIDKSCDGNIECLNEIYSQINSLTIKEIKNNFNAIVFVIDKKYLIEASQLDQSYNLIVPYEITPYVLKEGKWTLRKPYKVKDDKELVNDSRWRDNYIDSLVQSSNKKNTVKSTEKNQSISKKWIGSYTAYFNYGGIGGINAGWELNININENSIIASGDGYQMGFRDELIGEESNDKIILYHEKNLYGYKLGKNMTPEFIIRKNNNEFFVVSDWISDVQDESTNLGYKLEKLE